MSYSPNTIYRHADIPGNPRKGIINVSLEVPNSTRQQRDALPLGGDFLTEDQAVALLCRRDAHRTRHPAVREATRF